MSGSAAEKRIREKAVTALRDVWPDARIVHELMLRPGGCCIDLAAITESRLIVLEIKSERDVLTRLKRQALQAIDVADDLTVVLAEKHWGSALDKHVDAEHLSREDAIKDHLLRDVHRVGGTQPKVEARLEMLWARELHRISGTRNPKAACITKVLTERSGDEIGNWFYGALRARQFACADPPILSKLFPRATKGRF